MKQRDHEDLTVEEHCTTAGENGSQKSRFAAVLVCKGTLTETKSHTTDAGDSNGSKGCLHSVD